jgi:hypothetical protein
MASAMAQSTLSVLSTLSQQLTAVFVDDYGEIIGYLFETAQKSPQTTSNRDDFKFDDGESRRFTIGASGVFKMEKVCPAGADRLQVIARD